jgi:hypothetical protein
MKKTRFITLFLLLALVFASFSLVTAANPPTPSPGEATIDGDYSEWDLTNDFFAHMYEAGDPQKTNLADLYLRYDCETETLYTLTLAVGDYVVDKTEDNVWVAINGSLGNKLDRLDYAWTNDDKGVEASYQMPPPGFSPPFTFTVHMNVFQDRTAQTVLWLDLNVACFDYGDLPDETGIFESYTLYDTGARHEKGDLFLGVNINTEVDGKPDSSAAKDDYDDGIVPLGNWGDGEGEVQVSVTGGQGCLYGWLDFWNGSSYDPDFDFDDPGEEIISGVLVSTASSPQVIPFALPAGEIGGQYFARFRLFSAESCGVLSAADLPMYQGPAVNGEVEDYLWTFGPNAVSMSGFTASSDSLPTIWIAVAALFSIAGITVFAWMRRRTA